MKMAVYIIDILLFMRYDEITEVRIRDILANELLLPFVYPSDCR